MKKEESEMINSLHAIIYWTFGSHDTNISKGHIIAQCKKVLQILQKLTKEIDQKFQGPNHINNFKLSSLIKTPKHLAEIHKENTKIEKAIHLILTLVTKKEFDFTHTNQETIRKNTLIIITELGAQEEEIDLVLELIDESKSL